MLERSRNYRVLIEELYRNRPEGRSLYVQALLRECSTIIDNPDYSLTRTGISLQQSQAIDLAVARCEGLTAIEVS